MGETPEAPRDHNLVDFESHIGYATEGQTFCGVPLPNTLGGPQYLSQPQPMHFAVGRVPPAMLERERFDHMEERLRAIEGGGDYAFADMAELCLVPNVVIPPKFKVSDIDKYKGTTCPKNHLKMYIRKMGAYLKNEKLMMHFFQESLTGDDNNDIDMLSVFYYEKMVGYMPSSFADLVFTGEMIKVGLRRSKFDYPALMNWKLGANGENEKEGETHAVAAVPTWKNFPLAQQYQYSANISPSHYPPPYQPRMPQSSTKTTPKSATKSTRCISKTKHHP